MCSRAIIIAHGRILADATPLELARRSRRHNAVRLVATGAAPEQMQAELSRLPAVAAAEPVEDGDGEGLLVFPRGGEDIVADVADLARAHRWHVTLLRVEHGRLDDVFREITTAPSEALALAAVPGARPCAASGPFSGASSSSYFATPLAYVFIVIFLAMAGMLAFFVGNFFGRGQADLQPFFAFHPWLYLVLIPALSMRLWAEERKGGHDRAVPDLADLDQRGGPRQVPCRLGVCRDRAAR